MSEVTSARIRQVCIVALMLAACLALLRMGNETLAGWAMFAAIVEVGFGGSSSCSCDKKDKR